MSPFTGSATRTADWQPSRGSHRRTASPPSPWPAPRSSTRSPSAPTPICATCSPSCPASAPYAPWCSAGEGRGFCSGGDVDEIIGATLAMDTAQLLDFNRMTGQVVRALRECPFPVIAAVHGVAAGAGAVLALAADFRVADPSARFAFLFTRVGLSGGDMGAAYLLPRVVGLGHATRLLMLGEPVRAPEAERIGLISELTEEGQADEAAELARRLADGPALAVRPDQGAAHRRAGHAARRLRRTGRLDPGPADERRRTTRSSTPPSPRSGRRSGRGGSAHERPGAMRVAVVGGGPGGCYAAALLKRLDPAREITVWERNAPDDTFGFGVVLSDETLGGIEHADPVVYAALQRASSCAGTTSTSCTAAGTPHLRRPRLRRARPPPAPGDPARALPRASASTSASAPRPRPPPSSPRRTTWSSPPTGCTARPARRTRTHSGPPSTTHRCRYIWLAADFAFDAFRFEIAETEHGVMQLHGYPYAADASTVIVEMREEVWRAAGLRPSCDERESADRCAKIFARRPAAAARCAPTTPPGRTFRTVVNDALVARQHRSCSATPRTPPTSPSAPAPSSPSRTRSRSPPAWRSSRTLPAALAAYEAERRPVVASTQRAARGQPASGSRSIGRLRRPARPAVRLQPPHPQPPRHPRQPAAARRRASPRAVERGVRLPARHPADVHPVPAARPDPAQPGRRLPDGHVLGRGRRPRRLPPRPPGRPGPRRRRPGDDRDGLRQPPRAGSPPAAPASTPSEQAAAWRRITDFVHTSAPGTAIGVQLGHSGRKGSTRLMWEGIDEPLAEGNWPLVAASPLPVPARRQPDSRAS